MNSKAAACRLPSPQDIAMAIHLLAASLRPSMNACTPCLVKSFVFPNGQNGRDKRPRRRAVVCLRGPRQMLRELRRVREIMQIFEKTMHPISAGTSTTRTYCPEDGKCAPGS